MQSSGKYILNETIALDNDDQVNLKNAIDNFNKPATPKI